MLRGWVLYCAFALVSWWFPGWYRLSDRRGVRTWKGTVAYIHRSRQLNGLDHGGQDLALALTRLFYAVGWPFVAILHYAWRLRVRYRWARRRWG